MATARTDRTILGVDWSGARNAGDLIWIARGRIEPAGTLGIEWVRSCTELTGAPADPRGASSALGQWLVEQASPVVAGFDFPFGLPLGLMDGEGWYSLISRFAERFENPEAFRAWCQQRSGGVERKRLTDQLTRTPFCAYNLRMYRQTYWGIAGLLGPLVSQGHGCALPMQKPACDRAWLLETCPASYLKREAFYHPYKGSGSEREKARRGILDWLTAHRALELDSELAAALVAAPGADGLDAVIAAVATAEALNHPDFPRPDWRPEYASEAMVYA